MKASLTVVGIILAGGLARRMGGGDKCLLPLAGKTLLQRTIERAKPQVDNLLINANGNSLRFARSGLPVIADEFANNLGPLAGVHAGLTWMRNQTSHVWLASFASDTPFFPADLADQLYQAALHPGTSLVVASSKTVSQPVFALWHLSLLGKITQQLQSGEVPRLQDWVKSQNPVVVEFASTTYDPFFNINTPQDLYAAEPMVKLVK
jgi:molybdenum cofactor guanylyltransferase